VRAFLRALRDPATYDLGRNVSLSLGFVLALPIPILAIASSTPTWIAVISLAAPIAWAAILGAVGRVAGLGNEATLRMMSEASTAKDSHAAEGVVLRGEAAKERAGREMAETHHLSEMVRMTSEASLAGDSHAAERVMLLSEAAAERTGREISEKHQRLAEVELALAQRVNRSLLPEDIVRADLEVVVRQIPCSYVGGDYLHAALPRPDLLYLCVADVSGHGVSAALVVSRIHGFVQRWVTEEQPPEEILEKLNKAAIQILEHTPFFLTFAVFRVDLTAMRIDFATAGHPPQLLLRRDGMVQSLSTGNGLVGLAQAGVLGPLERGSASYVPGDTLILFTDGLFEVAARDDGAMLGESGLLAGLDALAKSPPAVVLSEILRRVTAFGRPGPFEDDVSLMVARLGAPMDEAHEPLSPVGRSGPEVTN
jgi:sigma-B regulation protein RsbU (phosphoserine phosphatase)